MRRCDTSDLFAQIQKSVGLLSDTNVVDHATIDVCERILPLSDTQAKGCTFISRDGLARS